MDFFHGTSKAFDEFDQDKIATSGGQGAILNGRGTYFTGKKTEADGWSGRNGSEHALTLRVSIDDDTWKNNFIPHTKVFTNQEATNLAVMAAVEGYPKTAEDIAAVMKRNEGKLTGKDLADITRHNAETHHYLSSLGFAGFNYKNEGVGSDNAVFFKTSDIPAMIPVATTYAHLDKVAAQGKAVPDNSVPEDLSQKTGALLQRIEEKGRELNVPAEKIEAAKESITLLSKAAAGMKDYDSGKEMHPLKLAEITLLDKGGEPLMKALKNDVAAFTQEGMEALGHSAKPAVFKQDPPVIPNPKDDPRFEDDKVAQAFEQRLKEPTKILSEGLKSARTEVLQRYPEMEKDIDRIIDTFHSPAVGQQGYDMRESLGSTLKGLARGEITPAEAGKKMESAAYFAGVDIKPMMKEIEDVSQKVAAAAAAAKAPKIAQAAIPVKPVSRFAM